MRDYPRGYYSFLFISLWLSVLLLTSFTVSAQEQNSLAVEVDEPKTDYREDLNRIKILIKGNVLELAEALLEQQGPPATLQSQWINWQKQLWAIYEYNHDWQALYQLTDALINKTEQPAFDTLPDLFRQFVVEKNIKAQIELGQYQQARVQLRQQIVNNRINSKAIQHLRKLIVSNMLKDATPEDATIAVQTYQKDYRDNGEDWLRTVAKIHMQLAQWGQAVNILAPLSQPESRLLRLYAHAKNQSLPLETVLTKADQLLAETDQDPRTGNKDYQILSVMIDATQVASNTMPSRQEVALLERYLASLNNHAVIDNPPPYTLFSAQDLLQAYEENALELSQQNQWLEGDYRIYYDYIQASDDNETKRILLGYLLRHIDKKEDVIELQNQYIQTLIESGDITFIPHLFGVDKPYGELVLNDTVGVALSNLALEQQNYPLAAWANKHIAYIPEGVLQQDWIINNARVAILAGDYVLGSQQLLNWLYLVGNPSEEQLDQVLQPVFDLQTANQHQQAIEILEIISNLNLSPKHRREIAYWLAQSYDAAEQYEKAADQFLYSALQKDNGFDRWGASARFQAAESLLSAQLAKDAHAIFTDLYQRATDPSRKTQLLQKLQQVSLVESSL